MSLGITPVLLTIPSTLRRPSQGYADLSMHGSQCQTPHIDKLAASGIHLNGHYGHSICTPTRAAIMSGR